MVVIFQRDFRTGQVARWHCLVSGRTVILSGGICRTPCAEYGKDGSQQHNTTNPHLQHLSTRPRTKETRMVGLHLYYTVGGPLSFGNFWLSSVRTRELSLLPFVSVEFISGEGRRTFDTLGPVS